MLNSTPHQKKSRSALFERNGILRTWSHGRNLVGLRCRLFEVLPLKTLQKTPQKFGFQSLPASLRSVYPPGRLPAEGMNGAASYSIRTGAARTRAPAGAKCKSPWAHPAPKGVSYFLFISLSYQSLGRNICTFTFFLKFTSPSSPSPPTLCGSRFQNRLLLPGEDASSPEASRASSAKPPRLRLPPAAIGKSKMPPLGYPPLAECRP